MSISKFTIHFSPSLHLLPLILYPATRQHLKIFHYLLLITHHFFLHQVPFLPWLPGKQAVGFPVANKLFFVCVPLKRSAEPVRN